MKVIIFLFYPDGGMYHYCSSLAKAMANFCDVYFFIPRSAINPIEKENLTVIRHEIPRLNRVSSFVKIINIFHILKQITAINPNIIHFPNTNYFLNLFLPLLKLKFPVVTTIHDPLFHSEEYSLKKTMTRRNTYKKSDSIIVHDRFGKKILLKHISSKNIFTIRHISLEGVFNKIAYKLERKKGDYILFFGRLTEYKGLDVLGEASYQLLNKDPSIKIKIFGKGKLGLSGSIFKKCDNVIIENRFIKDSEIPQIFLNSRFVVLPYTSATQSGIIPLAYYFGKPVLVTRVGGLSESVVEGKTGYIIQHGNPTVLAEKIKYLWNLDNSAFHKFEKNCKIWLKKNIDPPKIAKETLKVYFKTIEHR